jgi:hypothetical protein
LLGAGFVGGEFGRFVDDVFDFGEALFGAGDPVTVGAMRATVLMIDAIRGDAVDVSPLRAFRKVLSSGPVMLRRRAAFSSRSWAESPTRAALAWLSARRARWSSSRVTPRASASWALRCLEGALGEADFPGPPADLDFPVDSLADVLALTSSVLPRTLSLEPLLVARVGEFHVGTTVAHPIPVPDAVPVHLGHAASVPGADERLPEPRPAVR